MIFSLNNFLIIVGVLFINYAICIEYFDENDEADYSVFSIRENGCEFTPFKSRRGYNYRCGTSFETHSRGKLIIINNGTDQEEIIYDGDCSILTKTTVVNEPTLKGYAWEYCTYPYKANKHNFSIDEPQFNQAGIAGLPDVTDIDPKCILSCIGK